MNPVWIILAALALDLLFGDPAVAWHPVRLIGGLIRRSETAARRKGGGLKRRGVGLLLWVLGLTWLGSVALLEVALWLDGRLQLRGFLLALMAALLLKSSFAMRDLWQHARRVHVALDAGDLLGARQAVAMIVGRDTRSLDERGVRRACLESVAESFSDGVVAPLFYALIGGPPLALAYRALNTLDSMVGYKNETYRDLGWASARMDDWANYVPARLSALLVSVAAFLMGLDAKASWAVARIDGPKQPSPNAGWPEGAFAGALGVQLGGPVTYRGVPGQKATLGLSLSPLDARASRLGLRLYAGTCGVTALLFAALFMALENLLRILS